MLPFIAGGFSLVSGVMGAIGEADAADRRNKQALQAHYTATAQSGQRNGKAVFEAARNTALQMDRNRKISEAAYFNKADAVEQTRLEGVFKQNQLANAVSLQHAAIQNTSGGRNLGATSGSAKAMAMATTLNAVRAAQTLEMHQAMGMKNIEKQFKTSMSQQTSNVWIPNFEQAPNPPMLEDPTAALIGGIAGAIGSSISAGVGVYGAMK